MVESRTILLVEDEALIAMSEAMALRKEGYQVVMASSGEDAIALVEGGSHTIALILMDIDLGKNRMDGTEAAQEILKEHDIPILFLSSHSEPEVMEKTEKITSYGYVVKGSNFTVLLASIKMAFKLHAAHRELQQAKDYAENLISTANAMIVGLDVAGNLQVFNRAAERITGYTKPELDNRNWFEVLVPKERYPQVWAEFTRLMEGGMPRSYENPILTKSGEERQIVWQNNEVRAHGQIVGTISFGIDITERKRAEEKLLENERQRDDLIDKLNAAQQIAQIGSWDWDLKTNKIWWSDETYRIFGVTPSEYAPDFESNGKFLHPDDIKEYEKNFMKCLETGQNLDYDARLITPSGELKFCNAKGKVTYDPQGNPLHFSGVVIDITERKRVEDILRMSEGKYCSLFENMTEEVHLWQLVHDEQGQIKTWRLMDINPAGLKGWNKTKAETVGKTAEEIFPDPNATEHFMPIVKKIFAEGQPYTWESYYPGTKQFLRMTSVPFGDYFFTTGMDITEHKLAEDALREKEALFRSVTANMPGIVFVINRDGVFQLSDGKGLADVDLRPGQVAGKSVYDIYKDAPDITENVKRALAGNAFSAMTFLNDLVFETSYQPIWDENNAVVGVAGVSINVTAWKRAEDALRENKALYESLVNQLPQNLYRIDLKGKLLFVNKTLQQNLGVPLDEILGKTAYDFYPPDLARKYRQDDSEVIYTGCTLNLIEENVSPSTGEKSVVEVTKIPVYDDKGNVCGIQGIFQDITERKRSEDALRESEETLKKVLEILPVGVWISDKDGKIIHGNLAGQQIWAGARYVGPDEFYEYKGWWLPSHKPIGPDEWGLTRAIRKGETSREEEIEIECFDGSHKIIINWAMPLFGPNGVIEGAVSVNQDITERKRAEEALRENQRRYRLVFENSGTANSIFDVECRLIMQNSLSAQSLGTDPDKVLGKSALEVFGPVRGPLVTERMRRVLASGVSETFETDFELPSGRKWFRSIYQLIFDEQGKMYGIQVISQDITTQKQAEESLRQALADKDVLMRELQHRVKNSLNIVASLLSLEEENLSDEHSRAIFDSTRSRILSMAAVYEQLYETGGIDQIDLSYYIRNLVNGLSHSYISARDSVQIETRLQDVQIDLKRAMPLGIVLNELVTNALKYAFPAGFAPRDGRATILVELAASPDGKANLSVVDNGIGFRNGARPEAGTGLNLVEILARQIGGNVSMDGQRGCAVQVSFTL